MRYKRRPMLTAAIVLRAMLALAPLGAPRLSPEPADIMLARYQTIAADITTAATENTPATWAQLFHASVLLGIARHEAGRFERDVDLGPCLSAPGRCDNGRSVSLFQLLELNPARRAHLQANRLDAAREALRRARSSIGLCRNTPRFSAYASGRCDRGHAAAHELDRFVAWARRHLDDAIRRAEDPYEDG